MIGTELSKHEIDVRDNCAPLWAIPLCSWLIDYI